MNDSHGSPERLYPNVKELRETELLQESLKSTGAVVMGWHAFDMGFHRLRISGAHFVLTHHPPEQLTRGQNGQLKLIFVTEGARNALKRDRRGQSGCRGEKRHSCGRSEYRSTNPQCEVFDELEIGVVPILFGSGLRFFDNVLLKNIGLEKIQILESPSRTDIRYRVVK